MKILFIGDIVAAPGRDIVKSLLLKIKKDNKIDFVVANAENLAHGRGATAETIKEMLTAGVDYFTGGDHLFWQKGFDEEIDGLPVIRPANYPDDVPGKGFAEVDLGKKGTVLLINIMGRTFLNERINDPFTTVDSILKSFSDKKFSAIVVDFHAEASSEKYAMGFYLDGRVDAMVGTHTHVPTCDERILPEGTMFISDLGMTGIIDSVLGVKKEIIIKLYLSGMNQRFEWETTGKKALRSVIIDTDLRQISRLV